jgi:hypothetical protein
MSQLSIEIIEETLAVTLPTESVRVLCAQPFINLREPIQEPFPISDECQSRLSQGIDRVLHAANEFRPQFIVFPEFSIPGVAGVARLASVFNSDSIANSTILVGGVTGLSVKDFASLSEIDNVDVNVAGSNAPVGIPESAWVNTSITIAKTDTGALQMWLQPKISPSWPESTSAHQHMFKGRALHLFRASFDDGLPCRFFSALCYDWIGRENGTTAPTALLEQFNQSCHSHGGQQSINWVFVLQHNQRPNDDTFLAAAREFLIDPSFSFVHRDDAAIVMACTASSLKPARNGSYGCSSVVFGPRAPFDMRACPSTFTTSGTRIRNSTALRTCKDAIFREMGECFHAFEIRNPRRVRPDATDRTLPIENARVFSFANSTSEPRLPGAPVPAVVKWVNDELDRLSDISTDCLAGCPLCSPVADSQTNLVAQHRSLPSQSVAERIHYSKASSAKSTDPSDPGNQADEWGQTERDGLEHVIHSLAIIGTTESLDIGPACIHGRHRDGGIEIAAIRGDNHSDCVEAIDTLSARTHSPLLLISRDRHNTVPLERELECFADPNHATGVKITDSQTLLVKARQCTQAELQAFTSELFDVSDRRII